MTWGIVVLESNGIAREVCQDRWNQFTLQNLYIFVLVEATVEWVPKTKSFGSYACPNPIDRQPSRLRSLTQFGWNFSEGNVCNIILLFRLSASNMFISSEKTTLFHSCAPRVLTSLQKARRLFCEACLV